MIVLHRSCSILDGTTIGLPWLVSMILLVAIIQKKSRLKVIDIWGYILVTCVKHKPTTKNKNLQTKIQKHDMYCSMDKQNIIHKTYKDNNLALKRTSKRILNHPNITYIAIKLRHKRLPKILMMTVLCDIQLKSSLFSTVKFNVFETHFEFISFSCQRRCLSWFLFLLFRK